ncbi:DUF2393 family protein [Campylobacter sp. CX2-4080-23]|uniref:DUF2393 family protein n=1 Tax=Campylobacter porcelli TaxID=1660073 RepID=UPI002EC91AD8|nr:DUF2393 family protein [Campylobacter sp. CX2-4080-23]
MINSILDTIKFYINNFGFYDYIAISWVVLLFFALLVLALYMLFKKPMLALFILFFNFGGLGAGLFYSLKFIDNTIRPRELIMAPLRQLYYADIMIADINITNTSKKIFKKCRVKLSFHNIGKNSIQNLKFRLTPFRTQIAIIQGVEPGQTKEIKFTIKDFRPQNYNTILNSECF